MVRRTTYGYNEQCLEEDTEGEGVHRKACSIDLPAGNVHHTLPLILGEVHATKYSARRN